MTQLDRLYRLIQVDEDCLPEGELLYELTADYIDELHGRLAALSEYKGLSYNAWKDKNEPGT